jgi:hypothetical protein
MGWDCVGHVDDETGVETNGTICKWQDKVFQSVDPSFTSTRERANKVYWYVALEEVLQIVEIVGRSTHQILVRQLCTFLTMLPRHSKLRPIFGNPSAACVKLQKMALSASKSKKDLLLRCSQLQTIQQSAELFQVGLHIIIFLRICWKVFDDCLGQFYQTQTRCFVEDSETSTKSIVTRLEVIFTGYEPSDGEWARERGYTDDC